MDQSLSLVTLVVRDYDEAIAFFTQTLKFVLLEDTYAPEQDKRWVVAAPRGSGNVWGSRWARRAVSRRFGASCRSARPIT